MGVLGEGLPFAIEVMDPRVSFLTPDHLAQIVNNTAYSHDIKISALRKVTKQEVEAMKKWESENVKVYSGTLDTAVPVPEEAIARVNSHHNLQGTQRLPIRLLHYMNSTTSFSNKMSVAAVGLKTRCDGLLEFEIQDSNGIHVREFIHGDFGRTEPSLTALLGVPLRIKSLNVTTSECNWPPLLDS